jgi:uncharacterized protein YjiS (DUF1127 family)
VSPQHLRALAVPNIKQYHPPQGGPPKNRRGPGFSVAEWQQRVQSRFALERLGERDLADIRLTVLARARQGYFFDQATDEVHVTSPSLASSPPVWARITQTLERAA